MINRELIRVKIVQLTYAYYQNGDGNIDKAEKELLFSLSKAYDLYNYLLELIVAITNEERHRVAIAKQRAEREGTEAPSEKFINNKFVLQLEGNKQLTSFLEDKKLTWDNDIEAVRKLCDQIEQSAFYKDYIASDDDSYDADRELWRKIYRTLIQENTDLDAVLEDKSLYWNDDKEIVDTFVIKTIKRFDPANGADQELLPEYKDEEDRDFAVKLFRATILNADTYQHYMSDASRNWDLTFRTTSPSMRSLSLPSSTLPQRADDSSTACWTQLPVISMTPVRYSSRWHSASSRTIAKETTSATTTEGTLKTTTKKNNK